MAQVIDRNSKERFSSIQSNRNQSIVLIYPNFDSLTTDPPNFLGVPTTFVGFKTTLLINLLTDIYIPRERYVDLAKAYYISMDWGRVKRAITNMISSFGNFTILNISYDIGLTGGIQLLPYEWKVWLENKFPIGEKTSLIDLKSLLVGQGLFPYVSIGEVWDIMLELPEVKFLEQENGSPIPVERRTEIEYFLIDYAEFVATSFTGDSEQLGAWTEDYLEENRFKFLEESLENIPATTSIGSPFGWRFKVTNDMGIFDTLVVTEDYNGIRVDYGTLPSGLILDRNGYLHGIPTGENGENGSFGLTVFDISGCEATPELPRFEWEILDGILNISFGGYD